MVRRKITLASALPKPAPPPETVRVRINAPDPDDTAAATAFALDINGEPRRRSGLAALAAQMASRSFVRDRFDSPDPRVGSTMTDDPSVQELLEQAGQASINCRQCGGYGYSMQPVRSNNHMIPDQAMPCLAPGCEMGAVARALHDLRRHVKRINSR